MWTQGYAGCDETCQIEAGYVCGFTTEYSDGDTYDNLCSSYCGDGIFQGAWAEIGRTETQVYPEEFCDDGNNIDNDGCSALCVLEDPYGTEWTCENIIDSSELVNGEVVIIGHTECVDCDTNDSCVSNDETIISQTDIKDPSNTDETGIYLELTVTIPNTNGECTDAMATVEETNEVLYMCLDISSSMTSIVQDATGNMVFEYCCELAGYCSDVECVGDEASNPDLTAGNPGYYDPL